MPDYTRLVRYLETSLRLAQTRADFAGTSRYVETLTGSLRPQLSSVHTVHTVRSQLAANSHTRLEQTRGTNESTTHTPHTTTRGTSRTRLVQAQLKRKQLFTVTRKKTVIRHTSHVHVTSRTSHVYVQAIHSRNIDSDCRTTDAASYVPHQASLKLSQTSV